MMGSRELAFPSALTEGLERLAAAITAVERRLAGRLEPGTSEQLARLSGAGRHVAAARSALAGLPESESAPKGDHLQGSSPAVPIQDLLCFLSTSKKSGVLRVEAEHEHFLLQMREGAIVYATGDAPPSGEGLRELLAKGGELSAELLDRLPKRSCDGMWFDRNLVGTSWISRDALASAIQQQTRLSFFRMCSAHHTSFRFYEGAEIQNAVPVKQNAMELLLEYTRAVDEGGGRASAAPAQPPAAGEASAAPAFPG